MNEKIKWTSWNESPPKEKGFHWVYTKNRTGVHLKYLYHGKDEYLNTKFEYWAKAQIPKSPKSKK